MKMTKLLPVIGKMYNPHKQFTTVLPIFYMILLNAFYHFKVTIHFANNTAVLGSAIYMSNVDVCSWYGHASPFINVAFLVSWPIWQIE